MTAPKPGRSHKVVTSLMGAGGILLAVAACRPQNLPTIQSAPSTDPVFGLGRFTPWAVGETLSERPWITHVLVRDLDRDGRNDIIACDGQKHHVVWLRQTALGALHETVLATDLRAPVHVDTADLDRDGDLDLLVASMGQIFPNNDRIGSVFALENDGHGKFQVRVLLEHVARVTDVRAADFNRDGELDLAVAQFGYGQGEVRWMERIGPWQFRSHRLLDLSGAINVCIDDLIGDDAPDIVVLVSQQWEEIYLFANEGNGTFARRKIYGSTNRDFGSSGISLCDVNRDGRTDVLHTNGDGFDYSRPGPRPWHGVQWLENEGNGFFRYHRIGDLPGAYSPVGEDLDGDGDIDVAAVSAFANWNDPGAVSLMLFENDGAMGFTPKILAHQPTHLLTLATARLGADEAPSLITGGFHAYPPYEYMSRITVWRHAAR